MVLKEGRYDINFDDLEKKLHDARTKFMHINLGCYRGVLEETLKRIEEAVNSLK